MGTYQLGEMETRFAEIIWENEPMTSMELAQRAEKAFGWKKSTSYTVLKRLCEKGLFKNDKTIVTALVSREEYNANRSEQFVEETFEGSLPAFLAAFLGKRKLTPEQAEELHRMVEEYREE
ncbi:MAG: BlaI/MecI/CopY family transcriptional regulator [Lachnospiraceae bacterium]|nr:BlaI/MecI/CopY family transcriptional regulator [Lachnospiraceae bacterium]